MTEEEKVQLMLELFGWEDEKERRFDALRMLRAARGEPFPTWDSFEK